MQLQNAQNVNTSENVTHIIKMNKLGITFIDKWLLCNQNEATH